MAVTCRHCGIEVEVAGDPDEPTCDAPSCRLRAQGRARYRESQRRRAEERRAAAGIRDRLCPGRPDLPAAALPANLRGLGPIAPERRAAFVEYLRATIATAFASPPPPKGPTGMADPGDPLLRAACALCGGHCCLLVADHFALLDSTTIERVYRDREGASADEVLAAYVDALPERTFENSCVYHGATGCALPEDLRAPLCGEYFCDGLADFREECRKAGVREGFGVAYQDGEPRRAGRLTPGSLDPVDL